MKKQKNKGITLVALVITIKNKPMGIEHCFVFVYNNWVKNKNEKLGTVPNLSKKEKQLCKI